MPECQKIRGMIFFYQIETHDAEFIHATNADYVMKPKHRPPNNKKRPKSKRHSRAIGSLPLLKMTRMT